MTDDVFRQAFEILARCFQLRLRLLHLLAVFVDVEERNPANADLQQFFHIRVHNVAHEFFLERLETLVNRRNDRLVRLALLDQLVNSLFDKDAFQRAVMQLVEQVFFAQIEFTLENADKLIGVFAEHFADGQFHRAVVLDDDDAAGNGRFAIGERVKRIHHLLRIHAGGTFDLNLNGFRGEIADGFHLQLALARRIFDGADERIGRGGRRDFCDDHSGIVLRLDAGADFHRAFAVLIIARIHQAAGQKIRQTLERLLLEDGNLRFEQFGKIVRQNPCAQTDRDAFRAEHEVEWQFARQRHGLLVATVVAGNEIGDRIIEHFRARQFRQPALDVTGSRRRIAGEDVAEVSLAFDEIAFVRQHH